MAWMESNLWALVSDKDAIKNVRTSLWEKRLGGFGIEDDNDFGSHHFGDFGFQNQVRTGLNSLAHVGFTRSRWISMMLCFEQLRQPNLLRSNISLV